MSFQPLVEQAGSLLPNFDDLLPFEIAETVGGYSEFDTISPDDVLFTSYCTHEPVFRCSTLLAPAPAPQTIEAHLDEPQEYLVEPPKLKRNSTNSKCFTLFEATSTSIKAASSSAGTFSCGGVNVPEIPLLLMPTHFEVQRDIESLMLSISEILASVGGVSFELNKELLEWTIFYLNGSNHCKLQLHIYCGFCSGYVVEGNRLNGDSSLFRSLYGQVKAELSTEDNDAEVCYDSFTVFTPLPAPLELLSDDSDVNGLGPIFRMAQSPYVEAQMDAAKTLCEYSSEESIRAEMVRLGCIPVLMQLLSNAHSSDWVQQHALLAIANLSDCCDCHSAIVDSGLVPVLLNLCRDGTFETAEIRVLGAYILANLSEGQHVVQVASLLAGAALTAWAAGADNLMDERVRLHSQRVRESLMLIEV